MLKRKNILHEPLGNQRNIALSRGHLVSRLSAFCIVSYYCLLKKVLPAAVVSTKSVHASSLHLHTTHTHTHPFHGLLSTTTSVNQQQKGKSNLHFTEARNGEWQWHQLGRMQVCTLLQTENYASTPPMSIFYKPEALPATQPTVTKHWRLSSAHNKQNITELCPTEQKPCMLPAAVNNFSSQEHRSNVPTSGDFQQQLKYITVDTHTPV